MESTHRDSVRGNPIGAPTHLLRAGFRVTSGWLGILRAQHGFLAGFTIRGGLGFPCQK
nr:hypothetical protein [Bacteroidales bacterium]